MIAPETNMQERAEEKRRAVGLLATALTSLESRRAIDSWEYFHFQAGLDHLLTGAYAGVPIDMEYLYTPLLERSVAARTKVEQRRPERCSIELLRRELVAAAAEPLLKITPPPF